MFFIHRKSWIVRSALLLILLGGILRTLPVQAANATKQTVFAQTQVETALLVKDLNPGAASSGYSSFENLNGILYFGATDGTVGEELWKSDGTSDGTVLVKDIKPGASGSLLRYFENVNGTLYFSADDGLHGHELWKSDGTAEGTVLVKDINPSTSSSISNSSSHSLTNVNGILYFAVNDSINGIELWKSDGTEDGTVLVRDINPGTSSSNPENLVDINGTLFFTATVGSYDTELWKSDGTPDGTVRVKDIFPGSVGSDPYNLTNVNGTLYFVAAGDLNGYNDYELWRSDGTSDGTILIKDIAPGVDPSYPDDLESLNGTLYFFAFDGVHGYELWKSNGTTSGTVMVKDILVGAQGAVGNLTVLGNTLYFSANDAIKGAELWKSNGTAAGTVMVKDIAAGSASSMPRDFGSVNGILYFAANDGNSGYELWKSDGTASGTMFVRDINPAGDSWPEQFIDVNGTLYFNATDGVHGYELWKIGWGDPPPPTSTPSLTPSPTFTSTSTATRTPTATSMYTPTMISSGDTKRASVGSDGAQGNNDSYFPAIATDGRYIVFNSRASNLVPGDTNGVSDIFLHDMQTSMTTRVSVDSNGVQGNGNSYHPVVTADGRYIAFDSDASNLVAGDTNGTKDIFLHDRQTGVSTRVSVDSNGTQGNGMSSFPAISEDGSFIVFHSNAMNLVTDDTNLVSDVFLHVREMGQTRRISTAFNGEQTSNDSFYPSVSADGRFIAFESVATNIVSGDTNGVTDIFLYDGLTTETVRVSRNSSGSQSNNGSGEPSISANGRFVAFESDATNLVSGDTNAVTDVFLYDDWTGTTTRVSVGLDNLQGNSTSLAPSISADGRHITFDSYASNLVSGDGNAQRDAFVHDFGLRKTTRISVNSTNGEGNGQSAEIVVSADGEFLAFTSLATNLVADDTNSRADVFVRRQSVPFLPPTSTPTATRTATPSRTPTATFTRTPTPTPSLFQPYVNFDVGDGRAVTVGDFNNDGRQDVAMTNAMATTSQLFVFLQQSDGKLATPVSYDAGYQPHSLAVGDFNNDGRQDIVTTNMPSNEISVFLQQADGTLAPRVTYPTETGKLAVAAGDLNSDGLTDIAVAGSDLGVFTQNAGGTLNPMVSYPSSNTGTAYNDIAIGDIDNDGKNDVIKKHGSPMFLVYLQTENGNLTPGLGYSIQNCQTFCSIEAIDTGDVTGDGLTDIVMTYGGNRPTSKVAVFAQAQDGSLKPAVSYDTYDIPVSVEVADVNQDTLADVLVAHSSWTKISTALQQAVGTFSPYVLHSVPYSSYAAYSMAVGDINHDDLPDIAIADYNNGLVILYHSPSSVPNPPTPTRVPVNTPTITPSPTSTLTNTPAASSTPISSCDAVNHGALTFSGNTMNLSITNPTGIPLSVQDVFVIWDHDKGHLVGNDKTLILQDASLNGASFWSGNDDGPTLTITPLDLFIPPGTSTIVFTFHQTYEISDGSEELLISLATNGCQSYPIHAEYEPPTATPTNTFTPTVTPPYSYQPLYLSFTGSQTIGGVASADEDILRFDGQNWSLFFDGSDVGVGSPDLSAFSILDADTILMSFSANVTVNGITATPQDVLRFDATSLGSVTAGTFSMSFDGSDVSLADATNEKIDSLKLLPDGRLLISTTGNPAVPGVTGSRDEDVLAFTPTSLGTTTSGTWSMYFDGSDVGLSETSGEDIDALDVVGSNIYLSSQDGFSVNGVSGEDDDVFVCAATSTGDTTGCNYSPSLYFDGSTWGLTANDIDAFNFLMLVPVPTSTPTPTPTNTSTPTRTPTATTTFTPTVTSAVTNTPSAPLTLTVNSLLDAVDANPGNGLCETGAGNGVCTLRAAIQETNARFSADTIILPAGTYTLTRPGDFEDAAAIGDLDITDDLTILGAGIKSTVIDGNGNVILDRVFDILGPYTVTMADVVIRGGNPGWLNGGGIANSGILTLERIVLRDNTAGHGAGLLNLNTAVINDSTIANNTSLDDGGGIRNDVTLTVINTTISGNTAQSHGAGIENHGPLTITNSTISNNQAGGLGGGIYLGYNAISVPATAASLNNVTIVNNTADNNNDGYGDGGGIYISTSRDVDMQNSILAGNIKVSSPQDCTGVLTSYGYNLIQTTSDCTIAGDTTGNIIGQNPNLSPLQDNGGLNFTHALQPNSPAVNAGNDNTCESTDQRGFTRPQGAHCDMGAYEYQDTTVPTPTSTTSAPQSLTLTAIADARVSQASPTTNYGTATTLQADGGSGAAQTSFIRFNVSGLPGSIQSARLRVFCTTNGTSNGPAVQLANNSWTESSTGGITWNNQPALLSGAFDNKGSIAASSWVEYDVTVLVNGNGTYTFALVADSSDGVVFSAREGSTPPQLVLTLGGAPSTSTPSPTNAPSVTNTPTATASPISVTATPTKTATQISVSSPTLTATQTTVASTLSFPPIADAYVDANNPATNYGALATLRVDASPIVRSYLRFNVQGVNGTVTRATLRVFANSASSSGVGVSGVSDNTWIETGINYNSAPPPGSSLGSIASFGAGAWISIDVTVYVTGDGTYNLALTTPGSTAVSLASREAGANAPQLIIETTP